MVTAIALWVFYLWLFTLFVQILRANISLPIPACDYSDEHLFSVPVFDYKGVIHCHTSYSDGAANLPDLITTAQELPLDFIIISDHNTKQAALDGWEGWHHPTLVMVGEEASVHGGHLLVFQADQKVPHTHSQEAIAYANHQKAINFLAHPYNIKVRWNDWSVTDFTGIEVVNIQSMTRFKALQFLGIFQLLHFYADSDHFEHILFDNPPHRELKKWDTLTKDRKIVGIGGPDAHGFLKIGKKRYVWPHYRQMLRIVSTHILTNEPFQGDFSADSRQVYDALAQGHAYIAFDCLAPANGFGFFARNNETTVVMGDSLVLTPNQPTEFLVSLPPGHKGIIRLIRNGQLLTQGWGTRLHHMSDLPGTYRVEVYRTTAKLPFGCFFRKHLWLLSNPIYVA